jgi:hypothetical protein
MTAIRLYNTLLQKIQQLLSVGHIYRERNLAWFMTGVFYSNSVHISKVSNKLVSKAKRRSNTCRLSRFLRNSFMRVREVYKPVALSLLSAAAQTGVLHLIIDGTKVAQNHQLLMVSLAYRRRSLPIAWTWIKSSKGHSSGRKQAALLSYVHSLIPSDTPVSLVGDSEFTPLQALAESWGWFYALRQKGSHLYRQNSSEEWQRIDTLVTKPGECRWLTGVELTKEHQYLCNFLAYWKRGEKEPWLIATNFSAARETVQHYQRRMWIEEMFGDMKGNGADLEASRLRHFLRLSRLTLVVSLLYIWTMAFGSSTIKNGKRHLVDRAERRDLSIFRIGHDMLERCLINNLPLSIRDIPCFV